MDNNGSNNNGSNNNGSNNNGSGNNGSGSNESNNNGSDNNGSVSNESDNNESDNNESDNNETYINIDNLVADDINEIYQIQLYNNYIEIKHIGTGTHIPEIIIKENFGVDNSFNLYSCLYSKDELSNLFKNDSKPYADIFLPIIKLVKNDSINKNQIFSISIKIFTFTDFNKAIDKFQLYLTSSNIIEENIWFQKLESNINSSNIIEKIIENVIELGIRIL